MSWGYCLFRVTASSALQHLPRKHPQLLYVAAVLAWATSPPHVGAVMQRRGEAGPCLRALHWEERANSEGSDRHRHTQDLQ